MEVQITALTGQWCLRGVGMLQWERPKYLRHATDVAGYFLIHRGQPPWTNPLNPNKAISNKFQNKFHP